MLLGVNLYASVCCSLPIPVHVTLCGDTCRSVSFLWHLSAEFCRGSTMFICALERNSWENIQNIMVLSCDSLLGSCWCSSLSWVLQKVTDSCCILCLYSHKQSNKYGVRPKKINISNQHLNKKVLHSLVRTCFRFKHNEHMHVLCKQCLDKTHTKATTTTQKICHKHFIQSIRVTDKLQRKHFIWKPLP